jgi:hypothetical protein
VTRRFFQSKNNAAAESPLQKSFPASPGKTSLSSRRERFSRRGNFQREGEIPAKPHSALLPLVGYLNQVPNSRVTDSITAMLGFKQTILFEHEDAENYETE